MSCSASAGTPHTLTVRNTPRCFTLFVPPHEEGGALPLLIMHHGRTGGAGQFCTNTFAAVARARGFALLCTQAVHGDWQFDALPADVGRNACDSADQAYMRSIFAFLDAEQWQQQLDPTRRFQAGFSQGALFAAVSSFCAADTTVGFGQSGSSFAPMKMRVVPSEPPLRVCVWCNRDDSSCHPMTAALRDVGHEAEMSWHAGGGHDYPHPWLPKIVACLRLFGAMPRGRAPARARPSAVPSAALPRTRAPPHRRARLAAAPTATARDATVPALPSSPSRGAATTSAALGLLLDRRPRQPARWRLGAAGLFVHSVRRRLLVLGSPWAGGQVRASHRRDGRLRRSM